MTINILEDICSVTDLKKNTSAIIQQVRQTKRPVIFTVNGKAKAVLIDAEEYEKEKESQALAKMLLSAEQDISNKRIRNASSFFEEFRSEKKL